ncbi:Bax inhibitor-1/YccA family protein [Spirochaetales bacterium BR151]|uniref:Bax inhibitor-1/YccA family protein n=2 Tax=Entomospira culicis TaxID=2719989 RepID=A0A968KZJ5_9SPIO|nr:Bax inhibitor-1/YccA family protein [Entomospira culicis]NIZ69411.1 Bax inhibitor-1/YccA family protein [Entomospira culicis]
MEGYQTATSSLLSVAYLWMAIGLAITGGVAFFVASNDALIRGYLSKGSLFPILLMVAQIGVVMYLSARIFQMSASTAKGLFILYATLTGITFSILFLAYTANQLYTAFFTSAAMFGGAGLFGKMTRSDLTSIGHFARMAVWGLVIAILINMFLGNSTLDYIISFVGVVIFTALTAYDTQKIASWQEQVPLDDHETRSRLGIMGALTLYLDFINIFLFMLRLLSRRD